MVQNIVETYLNKAGLDSEKYSTHKLRHTAATLMHQNGVDIRVLQEILGHANLGTTQIYTHLENKQVKNALDSNPLNIKIKQKKDENKEDK
jgi:site-specific recombinase XerD